MPLPEDWFCIGDYTDAHGTAQPGTTCNDSITENCSISHKYLAAKALCTPEKQPLE